MLPIYVSDISLYTKNMLSLVHSIISLPLAAYLNNWLLIFIAAILLHLLADTALHWNIMPNQFKHFPLGLVFLDVIAGVTIAWLLVGKNLLTPPYLAAIAGGNIMDVLHALWNFAPAKRQKLPFVLQRLFMFHHKIQLETLNIPRGLIIQLIALIIAIYLLHGNLTSQLIL